MVKKLTNGNSTSALEVYSKGKSSQNSATSLGQNATKKVSQQAGTDAKKSVTKRAKKTKAKKAKKMRKLDLSDSQEDEITRIDQKCDKPPKVDLLHIYDSRHVGLKVFEQIIHPVPAVDFFEKNWETKPLLIKRSCPSYYSNWFSCDTFDDILRKHKLMFSVNIDATTYEDGVRHTHNPDGRAYASVVWDLFQSGCSIRVLNPQTYYKPVWRNLSLLQGPVGKSSFLSWIGFPIGNHADIRFCNSVTIFLNFSGSELIYNSAQEYFTCCMGANTYLTPPGTQGFAPHWDDIEAFVMQIEGKKHWKVYKPRSADEVLPRISSPNLTQEGLGEPILEVDLEAGDLLYMPRGFIHQGSTMDGQHSLHITVSTYQKNTWGDLMGKMLQGLEKVAHSEGDFRKGPL